MKFSDQLQQCRVLPVITAHDVESTVLLVQALHKGGMKAVEITLRTEAALASIKAVKQALPSMLVASGTVIDPQSLEQAAQAGVDFHVSPGVTSDLLRAANDMGERLLPGVSSASEVMLGLDHGLDVFKLFPAVAVGGVALLKSLAGPFPLVRFCPTGGLNPQNYASFLALDNVICCGGSWMVAESLVKAGRWQDIEQLAAEAMRVEAE